MGEVSSIYSYLKQQAEDLYVHPNGFIQIVLDGRTRVHFWHHQIPRQEVRTPIHDHIWDMYSCVLKGRMINMNHSVCDGSNYKVHVPKSGDLVGIGRKVDIEETNLELVTGGKDYYVPEGQYHESVPAEPSVTVIKKSEKRKERPRILVPERKRPDNSFDRKDVMDKDEIWKFVENMIDYEFERNFPLLDQFNKVTFKDLSKN